MKKPDLIVVVHLSATAIHTVIGQIHSAQDIRIIGLSTVKNHDFAQGTIRHRERLKSAIKQSIQNAEDMANCRVNSVWLSFSTPDLQSVNSVGEVKIKHDIVQAKDVVAALTQAKNKHLQDDLYLMHYAQQGIALDGNAEMIDDAIGDIMAALQRTGKADNTIVIFTSDHGDYLGDFNLLLKGAIMLRSINNVSFIWADPRAKAGATSHALTSTVDIAPSIIERAGLKPYFGIQGKSLMGNLDGSSNLRQRLVVEHQDNMTRMGFPEPVMVRTLLVEGYRLTIYKGQSWGELYDHGKDPHETLNRWDDAAYVGIRAKLMEELTQEMMANVDQSPRARRRA